MNSLIIASAALVLSLVLVLARLVPSHLRQHYVSVTISDVGLRFILPLTAAVAIFLFAPRFPVTAAGFLYYVVPRVRDNYELLVRILRERELRYLPKKWRDVYAYMVRHGGKLPPATSPMIRAQPLTFATLQAMSWGEKTQIDTFVAVMTSVQQFTAKLRGQLITLKTAPFVSLSLSTLLWVIMIFSIPTLDIELAAAYQILIVLVFCLTNEFLNKSMGVSL